MASNVVQFRRVPAPATLSAEARRLWESVLADYEIDDGFGLHVLGEMCSLLDQIRAVQAQVEADGRTVQGSRRGTKRPHPLIKAESEYRRLWLQYAARLNLDLTPPE